MKRYLWLFAGVAALLTGCSKSETDGSNGPDGPGHVPAGGIVPTDYTMECTYKQARSEKRGISGGMNTAADVELLGPGVKWQYNWGSNVTFAAEMAQQNMVFYPMAWNGNWGEAQMRAYKAARPDWDLLLAFNEPNLTDQANMIPSKAASYWPKLSGLAKELNVGLSSPAMNYGTLANYSDPIKWLDEFYQQPGVSLDDIAATAVHSYMPSGSAIKSFIQRFYKYNKPIYMTEFCHANGKITLNVESQMTYMCDVLNYMECDPNVGGYSWFMARGGANWSQISLLTNTQPVKLLPLGVVYVNFSSFDKNAYYKIGEGIPAEHYSSNSMAPVAEQNLWVGAPRVRPTTDESGVLELCDFYAVGTWVEYQIDVDKADEYALIVRYANMIDGEFALSVDGGSGVPVVLPKTAVESEETTWRTASDARVSLPAGKHTVRLTLTKGRANINWFCFRK